MKARSASIIMHRRFRFFWVALVTLLVSQSFSPLMASTPTPSILVTGVSGVGYNPSTAWLGRNTTFTATVSNSSNTAVTWSLQGGGTLTTAGLYTAPNTMPASAAVKVTATLTAQPSISATYSISLVNPQPALYSAAATSTVIAGMTSTIKLNGSGFVPNSSVLVNGSAVSTTYVSLTSLTAQALISSSATGSISVSVSNPAPVGGASSAVSIPVATPSILVTAVSGVGYNPSTAWLGRNTTFTATVSNASSSAVTWSLQGGGTLTTAGLYTAPNTMPASASVVVKATLVARPSISATYTISLVNPQPALYSAAATSTVIPGTTSTIKLNGSGFVPNSSVLVNGSAVPTTYVSISSLTAQAPISSSVTAPISVSVSNPAPVGGVSSAVSIPVSASSILVTAVSGVGYNPTTAWLGRNTTFTATVSNASSTAVTWSLKGAGTLTSAGLYTAPAAMPASTAVVVTATLVSQPSISKSYAITIVNPEPVIVSLAPTAVSATTNVVTVHGSGFVPGSSVLVNGSAVPTTYVDVYGLTAQVTGTAGETNSISITVQNPAPGGGVSNASNLAVAVPGITGATPSPISTGISTVTISGVNFTSATAVYLDGNPVTATYVSPTKLTAVAHIAPWRNDSLTVGVSSASTFPAFATIAVPIQNQTAVPYDEAARFSMQAAFGPRPDIVAQIQQNGLSAFLNQQFAQPVSTYPVPPANDIATQAQFTTNALTGSNLLRQRVAFALEEFITTAVEGNQVTKSGLPWQLLMEKDAFGNFRNLLTDVTLNATMGQWLNLGNNWASSNAAVHPNQNYARELLQLFTIGPVMLNMDGSTVLDSSGNPVSTIDTATVLDLSRALTGWGLPPADGSAFSINGIDYSLPMVANDSLHDHGEKTLFDSVVLPAGQTINQDLSSALDAIFNHQNVAPFISRLLIQHLVKSNPSPAYIGRVAAVFANDGNGVRGDLTAVIRAILLDEEARSGDTGTVSQTDGHLQEPLIYFLSVMSGLQMAPTGEHFITAEQGLGQYLWEPESVFSYYSPSFMIPGTTINAPEFQLFNGNLQIQRSQILYNMLNGTQLDFSNMPYRNTDWFFSYFSTIPSIVDAVNHMFFHGTMPAATQTAIESYCQSLPTLQQQQTTALYLALNSDSFQVSY